jgi:diguanylate cyclase (GGDEF)-like protein
MFIIFFIAIVGQDVLREVFVFKQETNMIIDELNRDIHNETENNVQLIADDFNYVIDNLHDDLLLHTEKNTEGLFFASNTFLLMNPTYTDSEIIDGISEITSEYSALDNLHNYFVYDLSGNIHYNGETDSFDSSSMIAEEDYFGTKYIEEFIQGFDQDDKFSVEYYNIVDERVVKFVLHGEIIEGTDLIISNVVNMETYSLEKKMNRLRSFDQKYSSITSNLFIMDFDGTILYHINPEYIGLNTTTEDQVLKTFIDKVTEYTETKSNGFLDLELYNSEDEVEDYIGYLQVISEWEIIVGSNVSESKYNDIIDNYTESNYQLMLTIKIPSYIFIALFSFIIFAYLSQTIRKSQIIVQEDEKLYRKFANLTSEIILITDKQGEVIFTNSLGNKAIFGKRNIDCKVFFDQILVEEEGYFVLYGYTEDFFVKFVTEAIEYNNQGADLYIISDVTEKIKTERKLEALSLVDELTKLGNRRMMVREYNEIVLPHVKTGSDAYLVMLDLDDFKPANDIYGHSYGDQVLKNVASIFMNNKDENIFIYRIGGDEFALIFIKNTEDEVIEKLKKMQKEVEDYPYTKSINVSFSAGIKVMKINDKRRRFSDYYDQADKLLYKSKKEGKRKISI